MLSSSRWPTAALAALTLAVAAAILAGCGGGSETTPTKLKIGVTEEGKTASFTVPKSVEGGLVELTVTNAGKAPHGVQLVRYEAEHTAQEVLEKIGGESKKTPDWIRGEGGIGMVEGGQSATATLNLEPGNFLIVDAIQEGGKPATAEMEVTEGEKGDLPSTQGSVTAEETGEDKYAWKVSGLKAGNDQVTFNSEGENTIHLLVAVPLKGKVPPISKIKEDLGKNGPPPAYVEFEKAQSSAVLDGGKSQTIPLNLKSGKYLFFCPLTDRDGGKPHDQEGLLSVETVK
jgi:hypothetical protein